MPVLLERLGHSLVGYLWAAFSAAAALTLLRSASDLWHGTMTWADMLLSVPAFTSFMTATIIVVAVLPAVIAILIGEALRATRLPLLLPYCPVAGIAIGWFLAADGDGESRATATLGKMEQLFWIFSGGVGGLAFWFFGARTPKSSTLPA